MLNISSNNEMLYHLSEKFRNSKCMEFLTPILDKYNKQLSLVRFSKHSYYTRLFGIKINYFKSEEDGTVSFTIKTEEKVDIREKLFYMMADNKIPILNMHSTKISLEDVFLELTENEKDDEKKAPEEINEVSEEDDEGQEEEENDSNL